MSLYRFTAPSPALRRAKLDNLALVPANLLPFKSEWQAIANGLPKGNILVVLPETNQPLRKAMDTVVDILEADGHRVTTLPAHHFT